MSSARNLEAGSLRLVRVFIASPSDLAEERHAARQAIEEINRTVARPAGFHVDLIGWEDTLSAAGRPQAIINEELESCQMFIGMLWARWGTPPDIDGRFTSGFEEEFHLALGRNNEKGEPFIRLFFKDVDPSKLTDPGPELSRVLSFKQKIIDEKCVLFERFSDYNSFARNVRISVSDYINRLARSGAIEALDLPTGDSAAELISPGEERELEKPQDRSDYVDAKFLIELGHNISTQQDFKVDPVNIARLRNIAASHKSGANDVLALGPHDANLIYAARKTLVLSDAEVTSLMSAGLHNLTDENTPLWSWLKYKMNEWPIWPFYLTIIAPDQRRIGAFRALTALRIPISKDEIFSKERLAELWFGSETSDMVKNSALGYIKTVGTHDFAIIAENELRKNNYATRTMALEAVIFCKSREGVKFAATFAIHFSFDSLSAEAMTFVLSGMPELDDEQLVAALDHRSGHVRAEAIRILSSRKKIQESQIRRFFGDLSFECRWAAVTAFESTFHILSDDEAKAALVVPNRKPNGLIGGMSYDFEGDTACQNLIHQHLLKQSASQLEELEKLNPISRDDYYFARADSRPSIHINELRYDFDDRFASYWQGTLEAIKKQFDQSQGYNSIVKIIDDSQNLRRRKMMRKALDIIIKNDNCDDLPRLRRALDEDAVDPRFADVAFLKRRGSAEDISRLVKLSTDHRLDPAGNSLLAAVRDVQPFAAAIIKLCNGGLHDILQPEWPARLSAAIIAKFPMKDFRAINRSLLQNMLHHESPIVRKACSLKIIRVLNTSESRNVFSEYSSSESVYYNVIFWLDVCEEWDRKTCRDLADRELQALSSW